MFKIKGVIPQVAFTGVHKFDLGLNNLLLVGDFGFSNK